MVKASAQRRTQAGVAPSRDDGEGVSKHQPQSHGVRRNCPWTEAEHLLFLLGLEEHGRGAWRAIASDFVGTRTATQVASHAQKYFLREGLPPSKREKKRPSIHDIRCSRNATQEDRYQLRNSLQQLNRESLDTGDSPMAEGQHAGAKSGTGALAGRTGRPKAETGSSGDTSVAAGRQPAPSSAHWSEAVYSGADGTSTAPGSSPSEPQERPEVRRLPDSQFAGRSAPLASGPDLFASFAPDTADPAVSLLDPLYDEVLNCELPTDLGSYPRTNGCHTSDMSLEHSYDQTHLCANLPSDPRPLFQLADTTPSAADDSLMLGSAHQQHAVDRRDLWQQPMYAPYGGTGVYDTVFGADLGADSYMRVTAGMAAGMRSPPLGMRALEQAQQTPAHHVQQLQAPQPPMSAGLGQFDTPQDRNMFGCYESSLGTRSAGNRSIPGADFHGGVHRRSHADGCQGTPQLQSLGGLMASQSAPQAAALANGVFSSALYRPTQLSLADTAPPAADAVFRSGGPAALTAGDSVDDLRILAARADEMGIGAMEFDPQSMDEILGSMNLGLETDV